MTSREHLSQLARFVQASPTSYHAADTIAHQLLADGFDRLDERETWVPGRAQFFVRGGAVVAWRSPSRVDRRTGLRIVGTHNDSPALKVKPRPSFTAAGWSQIGVEVYGGALWNSWLDRDLGVAGRIALADGTVGLVRTGAIARVPQLAIHLDRTQNEGLKLDPQANLQPVVGVDAVDLLYELAGQLGATGDQVVGHDLYTFPTEPPAVIGVRDELFASSRLDNLSSTHAALTALLRAENDDDFVVFVSFDHEEIGSATTTGAAGPLLADALVRIAASHGVTGVEFTELLARASCVSADAGHLVHPNYVARHDPHHHPVPNGGPLLKINANQRYATDATGAALWQRACDEAGVPTQPFVSNNAVPCGSTIGPITASRLGIATVDVGIGLLSMHSARELCGADDPAYLARALTAYWSGA